MPQKSQLTLGAVIVALVAVLGISAWTLAATDSQTTTTDSGALAEANCQRKSPMFKGQGSEKNKEALAKINKALADNDYQAWLTAVGSDSKQATAISADKFPRLVEAYNLEQEGQAKLEAARTIRQELGLPFPGPHGFGGDKEPLAPDTSAN